MRGHLHILGLALAGCLISSAASAQSQKEGGDQGGQLVFNNSCRTCHSTKADDNRLGPNLHKIVGRKSGEAKGFAYSSSLKDGAITWDEATLDKFIANPDEVAPGNNMKPFTGIADAGDRAKIIEFLKTAD